MKFYHVIFSQNAINQLNELYTFIANRDGEMRAKNFVGDIIKDCLTLKNFPTRGAKRDDIRPNLRVKNYAKRVMIAFSIIESPSRVIIHGIFYGGQNFEKLLSDFDE